jgi:hypothetical protein
MGRAARALPAPRCRHELARAGAVHSAVAPSQGEEVRQEACCSDPQRPGCCDDSSPCSRAPSGVYRARSREGGRATPHADVAPVDEMKKWGSDRARSGAVGGASTRGTIR